MTELDFPSVRYVYDRLAPRFGAEVVAVPSDDGVGIDEDRLIAAIDERTALVAISHVLFRSAFIMRFERRRSNVRSTPRSMMRGDTACTVGQ